METETAATRPKRSGASDVPLLKNYILGRWVESKSGKTVPNINPANKDEVLCMAPLSTKEETRTAIAAAAEAFPRWRSTPPPVR